MLVGFETLGKIYTFVNSVIETWKRKLASEIS